MLPIKLTLIGRTALKKRISEYYDYVMYNVPEEGQTHTWDPNSFQNLQSPVLLLISSKYCLSNSNLTIFLIQMNRPPMMSLP